MSIDKIQKLAIEYGYKTKFTLCSINTIQNQLKKLLPEGEILILFDKDIPLTVYKRVQENLQGYKQYIFFLEENEYITKLFSLPDNIRLVLAIGSKVIKSCKIFATLRNCLSGVIVNDYKTKDILSKKLEIEELKATEQLQLSTTIHEKGYPVKEIDFLFIDKDLLKENQQEAIMQVANSALIAIDIEIDSIFRGKKLIQNYPVPALEKRDCIEIYFASILQTILLEGKNTFSYTNCAILFNHKNIEWQYHFFCYWIERYLKFFQLLPRKYYVANYLKRFEIAKDYFGDTIFLENIEVPSVETSFSLIDKFHKAKFTFISYGQLLATYKKKVQQNFSAYYHALDADVKDILLFETLYNISAETTNLYLPPLLEREFGLLPIAKDKGQFGQAFYI